MYIYILLVLTYIIIYVDTRQKRALQIISGLFDVQDWIQIYSRAGIDCLIIAVLIICHNHCSKECHIHYRPISLGGPLNLIERRCYNLIEITASTG